MEQIKKDLFQASEHFRQLAEVFSSLKNSDLAKDPAVAAELADLSNAMARLFEKIRSLKEFSRKSNSDQIRPRPVLSLVKR